MKEALKYFEQIEDFVEGRMSSTEKEKFESTLGTNAALKKEYDAYLATQKVLEVLSYQTLKEQGLPKTEPKIIRRKLLPWLIAASLLIGSGIAVWFANTKFTNNALALEAYQSPKSNTLRGAANENISTYAKGLSAFQNEEYTSALNWLDDIKPENPDYANAQFLLGHTFYRIKQFNRSEVAFNEVLKLSDMRYMENANWNRAIALLQAGKETEAKTILEDITNHARHTYYHRAHDLLKDLDSNWRKIIF